MIFESKRPYLLRGSSLSKDSSRAHQLSLVEKIAGLGSRRGVQSPSDQASLNLDMRS